MQPTPIMTALRQKFVGSKQAPADSARGTNPGDWPQCRAARDGCVWISSLRVVTQL